MVDHFFIVFSDGSSLFSLPYPFDFCIHCLFCMIDREGFDPYSVCLVSFDFSFILRGSDLPVQCADSLSV